MFPNELLNGLWHSTSLSRYKSIREYGAILVEPNIPDSKRWGDAKGKEFFPFVRDLGGVSLFDFYNFNPRRYTKEFPCSSWNSFVPQQRSWKDTVWIEINRKLAEEKLISSDELLLQWKLKNVPAQYNALYRGCIYR